MGLGKVGRDCVVGDKGPSRSPTLVGRDGFVSASFQRDAGRSWGLSPVGLGVGLGVMSGGRLLCSCISNTNNGSTIQRCF